MNTKSSRENPVVETIQGKPIHEYTQVKLRLHHSIFLPLIRQAIALNIDVGSLIRMRMGPCQQCGHDKVEIELTKIRAIARSFDQHHRKAK